MWTMAGGAATCSLDIRVEPKPESPAHDFLFGGSFIGLRGRAFQDHSVNASDPDGDPVTYTGGANGGFDHGHWRQTGDFDTTDFLQEPTPSRPE